MKKALLFTTIINLITLLSFGQTVKDYKVPFQYIQLPLKPLNEAVTMYGVVLVNDFEQANQDTLKAYESRLEIAKEEQGSLLDIWNKNRLRIDRIYLSEMSTWEKAVNLGNNTLAQPLKKTYPEYPVLNEVSLPILSENVSEDNCSQKINLAGYNKGEGGVVITITHHGLQSSRISKKITGSGALKKYKYTAHFKMPVDVKIEAPIQGLIYSKTYYNNEMSELIRDEKSQYDYQIWWIDNKDKYWKGLQNKLFSNILYDLNNHININYGFPVKSNENEIYVIKKYKNHSYS